MASMIQDCQLSHLIVEGWSCFSVLSFLLSVFSLHCPTFFLEVMTSLKFHLNPRERGICKSWKQKWNWKLEMEMETGNDRHYMEMVVRQSIVLYGAWQRELTWKLCLHFDNLVLRLPYLFFGYCAGSWNNDDSDLTSSREAPLQ